MTSKTIRIIILIGNLGSGGKERRLIELLSYLKNNSDFEFMVILTEDEIHYPDFFKLNIPFHIIKKERKISFLTLFYKFYAICKQFKPHLIHTWGRMQSFYTLPTVIGQKIPLINSQITSAPPKRNSWSAFKLIDRINFHFSKTIVSNSLAGVESFKPPLEKSKVIYNGINLNRFNNLPDIEQIRSKYKINTRYAVVMVASFTQRKDYDLFYRVAKRITNTRSDITFIGAGEACGDGTEYNRISGMAMGNPLILFPGKITDVEALLNACTIGVLFTKGEGISNSILETMALAKPVIANDAGGTKEFVRHNENGYLIGNQTEEEIAVMISKLIDDKNKCEQFGRKNRILIEEWFSIDRMGKAFEQVYRESITC